MTKAAYLGYLMGMRKRAQERRLDYKELVEDLGSKDRARNLSRMDPRLAALNLPARNWPNDAQTAALDEQMASVAPALARIGRAVTDVDEQGRLFRGPQWARDRVAAIPKEDWPRMFERGKYITARGPSVTEAFTEDDYRLANLFGPAIRYSRDKYPGQVGAGWSIKDVAPETMQRIQALAKAKSESYKKLPTSVPKLMHKNVTDFLGKTLGNIEVPLKQ